jgi:hypothetical protein
MGQVGHVAVRNAAGVPHAQSGMAARFDISRRSSEPEDQKVAEAMFGAGEIVFSVHRPEKIVMRNPPVERGDQARETLVTDQAINFLFLHDIDASSEAVGHA